MERPETFAADVPAELLNGDRLTQPEFHALYKKMPSHVRAELIGGIVYMSSPVKVPHAENQLPLGTLLTIYESLTPGVRAAYNASLQLDSVNEPQPDLHLRILPEYGGSVVTTRDSYLKGAPEFVCEISDSTRSIDLNKKKDEYARAGIAEYLVLNLHDRLLHWFDLAKNRNLAADADGILRIHTFPGLWIDSTSVIHRRLPEMLAVLNRGLASPEHAAFVQKLAAAQKM